MEEETSLDDVSVILKENDEDEEEMNRPSDLEWNTPVSFDHIIPKNTVDGSRQGKRGSVWFQDWADKSIK